MRPLITCAYPLPVIAFALLPVLVLSACDTREPVQADCLIDAGACTKTVDGLTVTLDITPKPVRALRDLEFSVLAARNGAVLKRAGMDVDLSMPGMDMGRNIVPLRPGRGGKQAGAGVIVRCPSGRKVWRAAVTVQGPDRQRTVDFFIEVP